MPKVIWNFTIQFDERDNPVGPTPTGLKARSATDVEEMAEVAGLPLTTNYESPRNGSVRQLKVNEQEDSPRLRKLLEAIKMRYGLEPSPSMPVPADRKERFFAVRKERSYTKPELDQCDYLYLHAGARTIAKHQDGSPSQVEDEVYVAEAGSTKRNVRFGNLSPFRKLAVRGDLKESLAAKSLIGIEFEPVIAGDNIWKLSSSIILPSCRLPIVGGDGLPVANIETWSQDSGWRWFDDHGYDPPELAFERGAFESLGKFDIAVTRERTGVTEARSVRWCVVSQKFRTALSDLEVTEAHFAPVRIASEGHT